MSNLFSRVSTSGAYATTLNNIQSTQVSLSQLQAQISSGKSISQPSDNPNGAAIAESTNSSLIQLSASQGAVQQQLGAMTQAESTLGSVVSALQQFRQLAIQAGSGSNTASDRTSIANQMQQLRNQILGYANTTNSASGQALFGGQGSTKTPFVDNGSGVTYNGVGGQTNSTATSVPMTLNGQQIFMNVPSGNGVFQITAGAANTGTAFSDAGTITNPSALTGNSYSIQFTVAGGNTTYNVVNSTTGATVLSNQAYTQTTGQTISFDGMSMVVQGTPANGDTLSVAPSSTNNLFNTLDAAISNVKNNTGAALSQGLAQSLAEIDTGLNQVEAGQGLAGTYMNQANAITTAQDLNSTQLQTTQSNAQDANMVQVISQYQNESTSFQAALQSYAEIQKLSLFNYISG